MKNQPADERATTSPSDAAPSESDSAPAFSAHAPECAPTPAKRRPPRIGADSDPADNEIPALEPPVPLTNRFDPIRKQKRWLVDRIRESPSWLTSLVAHLALLLLLGSYIVPPGKRSHAFDLLLLFTEADDLQEEGDLVVVHTTMWETEAEQDVGETGPDVESAEQKETPDADQEPAPAEEPQPTEPIATIEDDEPGELAETAELLADDGDEIPGELDTLFNASADATIRVGGTSRNLIVPSGLDKVSEKDRIVDDFIEFDVGRLKGQAGQIANQRFQTLGRDAIPALVRGLNKSAYIRASCPVVVISQKLENELLKSKDPVMIQYAIDRLGAGVAGAAPHRGRILKLRERLRKHFISLKEQLAGTAREWSLPPTEALLKSATEASTLEFSQLRLRVASADPVERAGALLATSLVARRMDRESRYKLGMTIADQLARERDLRMAQVHHQAMRKLAFDAPVKVPIELASNPPRHAEAWRANWRANQQAWLEAKASKLMVIARRQQSSGKTVTSASTLRKIATDFPSTSYAVEAANMLGTLDFGKIASSQYNRAMTLEQAGNPQAALKQYEEVQIRFPKTKAAELARRRVNRIRGVSTSSE